VLELETEDVELDVVIDEEELLLELLWLELEEEED
jgi:hypothetical protein